MSKQKNQLQVHAVEQGEQFASGAKTEVNRCIVDMTDGDIRRQVGMIMRVARQDTIRTRTVEDFRRDQQFWSKIKEAGIPTLDDFHIDPDRHCVFTTDLTEGGTNYILSTGGTLEDVEIRARYEAGDFEGVGPNALNVLDQVASISEQLGDIGIAINGADAFYVVVDKETREARVVVADFKYMSEWNEPTADAIARIKKDNLVHGFRTLVLFEQNNNIQTEEFLTAEHRSRHKLSARELLGISRDQMRDRILQSEFFSTDDLLIFSDEVED